jgi:hypothetical protein
MDISALAIVAAFVVAAIIYRYVEKKRKRIFIDSYAFPATITEKVKKVYPFLSDAHVSRVIKALRQYFQICNAAGLRVVSMPSQVVDVAWHEFILFTRDYKGFCKHAFGRFLHHTPAEAMKTPTQAQDGIKRAWRLACLKEGINPKLPTRLPLLFAIDALLDIPDGFKYSLNCQDPEAYPYCAGHIGCGGGCGGGGNGDSGDSSSDGNGGCGGGCGGD